MDLFIGSVFLLLSATDINNRLIPRRIVFLSYLSLIIIDPKNVLRSGMIFLLYILFAKCAIEIRAGAGIGYGDIRMAGLTIGDGIVASLYAHIFAWLIACLFVAFAWAVMRRSFCRSLPFAPFLTLGYLLS